MPTVSIPVALRSATRLFQRLAVVKSKEPKLTVGLDIGSSAVKVVVLGTRKAFGARPLVAFRTAPIDGIESKIPEAIKQAVGDLRLPIKSVTLSVSGQWVIIRVVEMPKLSTEELHQALPIEAQRHLPFPVQDVVLDGAILGPSDQTKMWVLLVACKRELLERRLSLVTAAGLAPVCVDVDAVAVANAFVETGGEKRPKTYAVMEIGAQRSSVVVFKSETPYLIRELPVGGAKLIHRIAEQLGREEGVVASALKGSGPLPSDLAEALKSACEALTAELQLSFDFFESRFGPPPEHLFITGGFTRYTGVIDALKSQVSQPLSAWTPLAQLSPDLTVAYGLALRTDVG